MKFMLLMYNNETLWNLMTKGERDAAVDRLMKFSEQLRAAGKLILTQGLAPGVEAVSIRPRPGGERVVTDGPYVETREVETREVAGGYYIIECASRDEAIAWGRRLPLASWGVEVRRIHVE
jgi:hypothetical protein